MNRRPQNGSFGSGLRFSSFFPFGFVPVTGGRSTWENYTLDGVTNTDIDFNTYILQPSVDALQEFKVQSGIYPAEFGRELGQVTLIKGEYRRLAAELGLIPANLAEKSRNAYRELRHLQHISRLNNGTVDPAQLVPLADNLAAARALWEMLFKDKIEADI